ncbi:hypothetical protein HG536_0C00730 [Torulaspora globosa]|uniref:Something about silencing protein 4 domain-containing protein n=1 Tax=Torulaspora globosa TaxID=48254 RepID=A0A7G3ZEH0_9SACH|nr:uncharacterized protein HG536_0C00730 [Torulaspora globosa]QLL31906.1 hypothetical protein HG536_0C00730 [Torulaspora globosa]
MTLECWRNRPGLLRQFVNTLDLDSSRRIDRHFKSLKDPSFLRLPECTLLVATKFEPLSDACYLEASYSSSYLHREQLHRFDKGYIKSAKHRGERRLWSASKKRLSSMAGDSDVARSLRSKKNADDQEASKFNFDVEEFEIPPSKHLKLVSTGKPVVKAVNGQSRTPGEKNAADRDELCGLEEKTQKISSMILDIKKHGLEPLSPEACEDLLPCSVYSSFHRLMFKQETRMLEMDVVESEAEAERLHLLREKLDMIHWPITLRKVTVVNDLNDEAEILRKRELTKQCIDSMLEKFEAMKRRSSMLARNHKRNRIDPSKDLAAVYNQVDRRQIINYHSSSDEEEEGLSADQIRAHRRQKRQEQCRGSIIIQLTLNPQVANARYAIIAEPLRKPYVVKVSQAERNAWKKQMNNVPKKFKHHPHLADQVAVFKRKVPIPFTLVAGHQVSSASCEVTSETDDNRRKAPSIGDKGANGFDRVDQTLKKLHTNIHSPPIRKKRKKQE